MGFYVKTRWHTLEEMVDAELMRGFGAILTMKIYPLNSTYRIPVKRVLRNLGQEHQLNRKRYNLHKILEEFHANTVFNTTS